MQRRRVARCIAVVVMVSPFRVVTGVTVVMVASVVVVMAAMVVAAVVVVMVVVSVVPVFLMHRGCSHRWPCVACTVAMRRQVCWVCHCCAATEPLGDHGHAQQGTLSLSPGAALGAGAQGNEVGVHLCHQRQRHSINDSKQTRCT